MWLCRDRLKSNCSVLVVSCAWVVGVVWRSACSCGNVLSCSMTLSWHSIVEVIWRSNMGWCFTCGPWPWKVVWRSYLVWCGWWITWAGAGTADPWSAGVWGTSVEWWEDWSVSAAVISAEVIWRSLLLLLWRRSVVWSELSQQTCGHLQAELRPLTTVDPVGEAVIRHKNNAAQQLLQTV